MSEKLSAELTAIAKESLSYGHPPLIVPEETRAAVIALFRGPTFAESELLLILRAPHLLVHAGEVAFPGGGMDASDRGDPVRTALRECFEEVGVPPESISTLGILPMLQTLSGRAAVDPVLAVYHSRGDAELGPEQRPELILDLQEVSRAEWVKVSDLRASRISEVRRVGEREISFPVFVWGEEKMWGLTAMIFDLIIQRYDKLFP